MLKAPWSEKQVEYLNKWQRSGEMHPFTCPGKKGGCKDRVLIATEYGWVCSCGEYTQDWAHGFQSLEEDER